MQKLPSLLQELPYTCRGIYFKPLFIKFRDILLNFDDTLIKKVVKVKYKDTSSFLLKPNNINPNSTQRTHGMNHIGDHVGHVTPLIEVPPTLPQVPVQQVVMAPDEKESVKYIKKTSQPDVYEVYDQQDSKHYACIALVNNLKTSKRLREEFVLINLNDRIAYKCTWNDKFSKWAPQERQG